MKVTQEGLDSFRSRSKVLYTSFKTHILFCLSLISHADSKVRDFPGATTVPSSVLMLVGLAV